MARHAFAVIRIISGSGLPPRLFFALCLIHDHFLPSLLPLSLAHLHSHYGLSLGAGSARDDLTQLGWLRLPLSAKQSLRIIHLFPCCTCPAPSCLSLSLSLLASLLTSSPSAFSLSGAICSRDGIARRRVPRCASTKRDKGCVMVRRT